MRGGINIFKWEMLGAAFISVAGALNHFIYGWSGNMPAAAFFSAVNESTWEHIKMGFWPLALWAAVEFTAIKPRPSNFFAAKSAAAVLVFTVISGVFYGVLALAGRHYFIINISSFFISVFAAQYAGYLIMSARAGGRFFRAVSMAAFTVILFCFSWFTFNPPRSFLFLDPVSGGYGIPK